MTPLAAPEAVVTTTQVTKAFGEHRALDTVTVGIPRGVTGLVGANGAGKTTLLSMVLGLQRPTDGSLSVLGLDPGTHGAELRSIIGYSPERNVLPDEMQAYEFVRHLAEVKGLPREEARNRASDALWLVGLGEERFRPLGTMSTGQRQRVKLAQAIAADPRLVVLDEPTEGLDPVQRDGMLELIATIGREFGIDIVLSSHVLEEVERVCEHVVVLNAGKLVTAGRLDELAGETGGVEVELVDVADRPGSIDAVVAHLTAAGVTVERDHLTLTLTGGDDADLQRAAVAAVAGAGGRLRRLGTHYRSLEDVVVDEGGYADDVRDGSA